MANDERADFFSYMCDQFPQNASILLPFSVQDLLNLTRLSCFNGWAVSTFLRLPLEAGTCPKDFCGLFGSAAGWAAWFETPSQKEKRCGAGIFGEKDSHGSSPHHFPWCRTLAA
jgi:hypothetical protein